MPNSKLNTRAHDLESMICEIHKTGCVIEPVLCVPPYWKRHKAHPKTSWKWISVPFKKEFRKQVPDNQHGIYSFIVQSGLVNHPNFTVLLYVGKAEKMSFREEFSRYFGEMRSYKRMPLSRWLHKCRSHLHFCFCPFQDTSLIDSEERKLNAALLPPGNEKFEGELNAGRKAF